ncbi:TPA: hypothetical protein JZG45_004812 [Escherichia coli]|nr:hypothetical protein [Escherichia coli]
MSAPANLRCLENKRDYGGFLYLKFTFLNKISAPRFLHLQIAENLPANLAAWAQSINDVQALLFSFLIQNTSLTGSPPFRTTAEALPY